MRILFSILNLFFLLAWHVPAQAFGLFPGPQAASPQSVLKKKLADLDSAGRLSWGAETILKSKDLAAFYQRRDCKPAWFSHGSPVTGAWQLLDAVRKCGMEGLEPADYHGRALDSILSRFNRKIFWRHATDPETAARLDILLTDAYLKLGGHLLYGRLRPKIPQDIWHVGQEKIDLAASLSECLAEKKDVRRSIQSLTPPQREYGQMKYWLGEYRKIAEQGGWPAIPEGPPIGDKSSGPRVEALCRRLKATGEMGWGGCGESYSQGLAAAVKRFQGSHALDTTGLADGPTLRALNIPVEERIDQIELNLDCWRWLPQDLGDRHLRVNIVDFRLGAFEAGREVFSMKVVVGRKADSTPVFSDRAVSVQLNPSWNVPASIAAEEMLPELKADPGYLAKHDMELLADWSENAQSVRAILRRSASAIVTVSRGPRVVSKITRPESGGRCPAKQDKSVDFPEPLSPTIPSTSPEKRSNDTSAQPIRLP